MAAGAEQKKTGERSPSQVHHPDFEETNPENEIEHLNNLLDHLEHCVENLDQQASSLTDKIKEFLAESQNDATVERNEHSL